MIRREFLGKSGCCVAGLVTLPIIAEPAALGGQEGEQQKPKKYRVTKQAGEISFPTDREVIERIKDGERVPFDERGMKTVKAGKTTTEIPPESVPWLLEQGLIEEVK